MHRTLTLPYPWSHQNPVEVSGFVPPHDGRPDEVKGRASLTLRSSGFELSLRPTAAELRDLAALCRTLADDLDAANVPVYGAQRARWPDGLQHLQAVPGLAVTAVKAARP
jgi:hypothetical protein